MKGALLDLTQKRKDLQIKKDNLSIVFFSVGTTGFEPVTLCL